MKKFVLGAAVISCVVMFAGVSMAAFTWDTCSIDRIGVSGDSDNVFKVKDCVISANSGNWIMISKQKDTSMATLLTALSLGKQVKMQADFADTGYYKPLESLFLNQ